MVNERGIEVDPNKIRVILNLPAPRIEREIKGFLGRLQYISRFIARLTNIFSDIALECMLAQLDDSERISDGRAIDDDFPDEDIVVVTSLSGVLLISSHGDHIPRFVCLGFSYRHPATNNIVEYEACILELETTLELGIRQMEVFGDSNMVLRQIQGH
ncbi:hypothetical protein AAG906_029225 [Vitis piasezkii]